MTDHQQVWTSDAPDQIYTHIDQVIRKLKDAQDRLSLGWRSSDDPSGNDDLLTDVARRVGVAQHHLTSVTALLAQRPGHTPAATGDPR